jgi:hypothetical protein
MKVKVGDIIATDMTNKGIIKYIGTEWVVYADEEKEYCSHKKGAEFWIPAEIEWENKMIYTNDIEHELLRREIKIIERVCQTIIDQRDSANARIAELEAALEEALSLDRLMGQLASALRNRENHEFIEPFLKTGLSVINRAKDALAKETK